MAIEHILGGLGKGFDKAAPHLWEAISDERKHEIEQRGKKEWERFQTDERIREDLARIAAQKDADLELMREEQRMNPPAPPPPPQVPKNVSAFRDAATKLILEAEGVVGAQAPSAAEQPMSRKEYQEWAKAHLPKKEADPITGEPPAPYTEAEIEAFYIPYLAVQEKVARMRGLMKAGEEKGTLSGSDRNYMQSQLEKLLKLASLHRVPFPPDLYALYRQSPASRKPKAAKKDVTMSEFKDMLGISKGGLRADNPSP